MDIQPALRELSANILHRYQGRFTCPNCRVVFNEKQFRRVETLTLPDDTPTQDKPAHFSIRWLCPTCHNLTLHLASGAWVHVGNQSWKFSDLKFVQVWPKGTMRPACPVEVSTEAPELAEDYSEASLVLNDSPKASAALSRRCLQRLLELKGAVTSKDLGKQIDEVMKSGVLPIDIAEQLHHMREIGNFAAHTQKSSHTGEILPVEVDEAEWNLDVLEELFEFFYVRPARVAARKAAFAPKLADAGRKPLT